MKIHFMSFYSGTNNRGVERWVNDLATRLSKAHEVTVYQNRQSNIQTSYEIITSNLDYKEVDGNYFTKHMFIDYKSRKVFCFTLKFLKSLIKGNYDIIIPTDGGWEPAIVRLATWVTRRKMIIVGHAGIGFDDANNLWSFPNVFVALSPTALKWAKKVNPYVKTVLIPDAVDTEKFNIKGKKTNLGFENNFPVALCVGALENGKRIDLVIKAVSKIKNLNLLVCGRGELEKELSALGEKLLDNRFKINSYDFNEMPNVYRACDVLLSSSDPSYSFEMVLLESMACGIPVVANNDPIRESIVGDAGVLVDVENTEDFSDSIEKVLRKNWGDLPRKQAEKYSWDKIIDRYEEMLLKTKD